MVRWIDNGDQVLVEVKVVDNVYLFYGVFKFQFGQNFVLVLVLDGDVFGVVGEFVILVWFGIEVGDMFNLGCVMVCIIDIIEIELDKLVSGMEIGLCLMVF